MIIRSFLFGILLFPMQYSSVGASDGDKFIDLTLKQMGLAGQIGQMAQIDVAVLLDKDTNRLRQDLLEHYIGALGIGSVLNNIVVDQSSPEYKDKIWKISDYRAASKQIQETAKKHKRPPVIWGLDSVHGANYLYDTITTPQPLNLAATFNTTLSYMAGKWASTDTRRAGIPWLFSPLLGLSWSPRWSRVYETFGEDPVVVGSMAQAMIKGIQEEDDGSLIPSRAAACAKHWVGYSMPLDGHDRAPSWIPTRHLYQYFLPPWKKVINEVDTVMEDYTEVDGVPNVANRFTLNVLLRKTLDFDGLVVTDYNEIYNLFEWHHTASDRGDALKKALEEGTVDMSMIAKEPDDYFQAMNSFNSPQLMARIETSARRVLELKQKLNMFDEAFRIDDFNATEDRGPTNDDLKEALDMTTQSIVLVENKDNALPLDSEDSMKVLVTGPTSNSRSFQTGGWTFQWQGVDSKIEDDWFTYGSTVRDAIEEQENWEVTYECGTCILGRNCENEIPVDQEPNEDNRVDEFVGTLKEWVGWKDSDQDHLSIKRAMNQAENMDVIIVCIGEENYAEKPGDIRSLELPSGQYELVMGLRKTAPDAKIIVVYFGGRPRLLRDIVEYADAIFLGFLPGPMAGDALRDLLIGKSNPSGKLPITYPKFDDGGGIPYLHAVSDLCTKDTGGTLPHWENTQCEVQWPFGHGKSYTKFEYSGLSISSQHLNYLRSSESISLNVTLTVKNTGILAGSDTILFFTFDENRATTPEYKRLRGFEKVWLEPGTSIQLQLSLPLDDFRFVGPHDATHYTLQDGMTFRFGISAHIDCRENPDDDLCSAPITMHTDPSYVGACEAACNLWENSGCTGSYGMTSESCWDMCTSIQRSEDVVSNNDGWGWNYVQCMEAIVFEDSFDTDSCWKLGKFCRDVMATPGEDEFGNGPTPRFTMDPFVLGLALLSGIAASLMVFFTMQGRCSRTKGEQYGDVQFAQISRSSGHELMMT